MELPSCPSKSGKVRDTRPALRFSAERHDLEPATTIPSRASRSSPSDLCNLTEALAPVITPGAKLERAERVATNQLSSSNARFS